MRPAVNGDDLLLDTNAFIYFLDGRGRVAELVLLADTIYYSVISEIELLSAPHLTEQEAEIIQEFLARCQRVDLTPAVVERTIVLRKAERLKTPDAIVVASAQVLGVTLVTADKRLSRIPGLTVIADILE